MPNQIDINQKPIFEPDSAVQQDGEAQADVKLVLSLLEEEKKSRARFDQDWKKQEDFYNGKQWDTQRAAYKAAPVLNIIEHAVQAQLPILTDAKPGFNVVPPEPSDYPFADMCETLVDYWWDNTGMGHTILEPLTDAKVIDAGIVKVIWDEKANEGRGEVAVEPVDPNDIFVPHEARDFIKNCPWVIQRLRKMVGELRTQFPDMAQFITPDDDGTGQNEIKQASFRTDVTLVSPIDKHDRNVSNAMPAASGDERKTCEVLECWIEDHSIEEYLESNDETGETVKKYKKRFPRGKLITILPNKKLRLQGVENPYEHARHPFVRFIDVLNARSFWGRSLCRTLLPIQRNINKILANILDYMNQMGNPIWKIKVGSVTNPDMITNKSGMVLLINQGFELSDAQREQPPPMPNYFGELYEMMLRAAEMISGTSEITEGRRKAGDPTAGYAIEALQEASQTRIRLQERNMQVSLGQLGYLVLSLMMQYYKTPRVVRITGKQGWPEYFEFFVEDTPDGKVMNKRKYNYLEAEDKYVPEDSFTATAPTRGMMDVKVLSGSALPFAKRERMNLAFKLDEGQIIDGEEVLTAAEWPNKEQVQRRMEQKQAAMPVEGEANAPVV